jgi:hypothetical protein
MASKLGIAADSLEELLTGKVPDQVASKLSTSSEALQEFVDGVASPVLIWTIGAAVEDLQRLRDRLGRAGAIGLVVGLLTRS